MLQSGSKVFVAGHRGMVGSAILRCLKTNGYQNSLTADRSTLDLRDTQGVAEFLRLERPEWVVIAAAKVGGILANSSYPADFLYDNLMIQCNLIHGAFAAGIQQILFLGSSCIYPKLAPQPIREAELLNGYLEPTNEAYAIAKIAGIKLCESYNRQHGTDYRSLMPTNLYGPNDNFHPTGSHVIPGLMHRLHEARVSSRPTVDIWGSGTPRREFLHVDDLAEACMFVIKHSKEMFWKDLSAASSHINVGTGADIPIRELAETVAAVVGYRGRLVFNTDKPDGTPRKLLDVSKLHSMGWHHRIALKEGLESTYGWFIDNIGTLRH